MAKRDTIKTTGQRRGRPMSLRSAARYAVPVAAALLLGGPASSTSAQEPPETTVLVKPCEERCGLTLVPVVEFGEDAGPGMIERARGDSDL